MKVLHRSALLVRPKEPYIRWAASLDKDAPQMADELRGRTEAYLVSEREDDPEGTQTIERFFPVIFESELHAWHTDPTDWPRVRDLDTFQAWFEVEVVSLVTDLDDGELTYDEL